MQALPTLGVAILAAALVTTPAESQWRRGTEYKADRAADAPARGATEVLVTAMSGSLEVIGRPGLSEVRARGTARASREAWLPGIPLTATRRGLGQRLARDRPRRRGAGRDGGGRDRRQR